MPPVSYDPNRMQMLIRRKVTNFCRTTSPSVTDSERKGPAAWPGAHGPCPGPRARTSVSRNTHSSVRPRRGSQGPSLAQKFPGLPTRSGQPSSLWVPGGEQSQGPRPCCRTSLPEPHPPGN